MSSSAMRARLAPPRAPRASRARARRNPERGATSRAVTTRASVSEAFKATLDAGKRAFIPFICAGDPDLESTKKALKILDDAGADVIELGVPYSDPLADGPVIQAAATRALENGATLNKVIDLVREMTPQIKAPIVMFTYYNPIYQRGVDTFCADIAAAGAKGLLVPDIPLEETYEVSEIASKHGIELVLLSTPTTPVERAKKIAQGDEGIRLPRLRHRRHGRAIERGDARRAIGRGVEKRDR
jgi:tryptophan synthase alpha chain